GCHHDLAISRGVGAGRADRQAGGKTPEGWKLQLAKNAQKDKDARWTKKNDESFYGYKNHLGVDKAHKLIRKWDATHAAVHDSQKLEDLLDLSNTGNGVWADSAYHSDQIEANLKAKGLQSRTRHLVDDVDAYSGRADTIAQFRRQVPLDLLSRQCTNSVEQRRDPHFRAAVAEQRTFG